MKRLLLAALIAIGSAGVPAFALTQDVAQSLTSVPLTIHTRHHLLHYRVEVARSPQEQEIGLMFRRTMPARHGMIFPMNPPRPASFWMKNTLIPLDLVFIRPDGTIGSIATNAPPLSLATIESHEPVAAVLELVGGAAARDGLRAGDRVRW